MITSISYAYCNWSKLFSKCIDYIEKNYAIELSLFAVSSYEKIGFALLKWLQRFVEKILLSVVLLTISGTGFCKHHLSRRCVLLSSDFHTILQPGSVFTKNFKNVHIKPELQAIKTKFTQSVFGMMIAVKILISDLQSNNFQFIQCCQSQELDWHHYVGCYTFENQKWS